MLLHWEFSSSGIRVKFYSFVLTMVYGMLWSSMSKYDIKKLSDLTNFSLWQHKVRDLLIEKYVFEALQDYKPDNIKYMDWNKIKLKTTSASCQCLWESAMYHVSILKNQHFCVRHCIIVTRGRHCLIVIRGRHRWARLCRRQSYLGWEWHKILNYMLILINFTTNVLSYRDWGWLIRREQDYHLINFLVAYVQGHSDEFTTHDTNDKPKWGDFYLDGVWSKMIHIL